MLRVRVIKKKKKTKIRETDRAGRVCCVYVLCGGIACVHTLSV